MSAGADLHSQVTADLDPAVKGIRQLRMEYNALGIEIRKTNQASRDLQRMTNTGNKPDQRVRQGVQIASRVPGASSAIGAVGQGASMDGTFGRVAVAAGILLAGVRAHSAVISKITTDATETASRRRQIDDRMLAALAQRGAMATTAVAGIPDRQRLLAGGANAPQIAQDIAQTGRVSTAQATAGVSQVFGRLGHTPKAYNTLTAAFEATLAGMPFDQAAAELLPSAQALGDDAQMEAIVGRIVKRWMGRVTGDPRAVLAAAQANVAGDAVTQRGIESAGVTARGRTIEEQHLLEQGSGPARKALGEMENPEAAALLQIHKENQKQTAALEAVVQEFRRRRDDKTFLSHPISNLTLQVGEFMAEQRLFRENRIQAETLFRAKE